MQKEPRQLAQGSFQNDLMLIISVNYITNYFHGYLAAPL